MQEKNQIGGYTCDHRRSFLGAKDREDALKNVSLGDPIVPDTHIRKMTNGKFTARALDDRLGVYIIMEAIKRAKELGCKVGVYGASTTGEETTKTGAFWTSTRINPTLAIVVDVTYTSDCSGMDPAEMGTVLLGGWTGSLQQSDRGKNFKCQNGRMCKKSRNSSSERSCKQA